jgi:hypothetical protein
MLTYRKLKEILDKHPEHLDEHISIWDAADDECFEVHNAYFNNEDSPTSDVLDKGHLVLFLQK